MADDTTVAPDPWAIKQPPNIDPAELERWHVLRGRTIEKARQHSWTKSEVSRRSGIAQGTLWAWLDGSYMGQIKNVSARVEQWLESIEELGAIASRLPIVPGYVATPTSQKVVDALLYAQTVPDIAVVTLASGMGKTQTLSHYCSIRPHAFFMTMRPLSATLSKMMRQLAETLDLPRAERGYSRIEAAIGEKLQRNGKQTLLAVDEAQHLEDEAVNQLRYFHDIYGVGIALLGNEELYGRFGGKSAGSPAYAQLQSRFGPRLRLMSPTTGDIDILLDAWSVDDAQIRKLVMAIGRKPGTLRNVTKTLQLAGMFAAGEARAMTADDIRLAAHNRGLEG